MKDLIVFVAVLVSTLSYSQQTDYSLARSGDYVLGVYLFIGSEPVNNYDYVGKVNRFNVFETDQKEVEKIIKKARKKNPHFNGMIFKRNFNHVELIRFPDMDEKLAGFSIGDTVSFTKLGVLVKGKIVSLDDAKQKASIVFVDEEGVENIEKVAIKSLTIHK